MCPLHGHFIFYKICSLVYLVLRKYLTIFRFEKNIDNTIKSGLAICIGELPKIGNTSEENMRILYSSFLNSFFYSNLKHMNNFLAKNNKMKAFTMSTTDSYILIIDNNC